MPQCTEKEPETPSPMQARLVFCSGLLIVLLLLTVAPSAPALQATPRTPASSGPALTESLRPALVEVGSALQQIRIDHWKLSKDWKSQLSNDADSIQQDLSADLPGLLHTAQQAPDALGPQMSVMHNVGALCDVLLRITMAADLSGGKTDAALLDNAVRQLESASKQVSTQLQQEATRHDQELAQFHAEAAASTAGTGAPAGQPKTIVVNNRVGGHAKHRMSSRHTKPTAASEPGNGNSGTSAPSH